MKKIIYIVLFFCSVFIVSSCVKDRCVEGNNRIVHEYRSVSGFDGITSDGDYEIYIEQNDSDYYEVMIEADANITPYVYTTMRNYTLEISTRNKCLQTVDPIKVYIKTPHVSYLSLSGSGFMACDNVISTNVTVVLSGSGEISMFNLNADRIDVSVPGSGRVELKGLANSGYFTIAGSGIIDACGFDQNKCEVTIPGSGEANVYVHDLLDVLIPGSGSVYYGIQPNSLVKDIPGSGYVSYDPKCH